MRKIVLWGFFGFFAALYVASNIFMSQALVNPLMFKLITLRDSQATHEFLANLEGSPLYVSQLRYFNSQYDNAFAREIDTQHLNTQKALARYEELLKLNPRSRDVLVELALLEKDLGNNSRAQAYYDRAKEVDIWLQVPSLERI